jgi:DnaJ like chaperone protein
MTQLLIFLVVAGLFYYLNKDYKSEDYQHIQVDSKQKLQGNLIDHEAGLLVALLAKVAKADGKVGELEAELLSHTFTDIASHFENSHQIREQLKQIYKEQKDIFENTIEISQKYLQLSKNNYQKRLQLMEYLLNLAFIDGEFSKTEFMITEDIANALQIKRADFEELILKFETFYANKEAQTKISKEKACKILEVDCNDSIEKIKKQYRKLVKQYHPDIITSRGGTQQDIQEATRKLQEINEAYELFKSK